MSRGKLTAPKSRRSPVTIARAERRSATAITVAQYEAQCEGVVLRAERVGAREIGVRAPFHAERAHRQIVAKRRCRAGAHMTRQQVIDLRQNHPQEYPGARIRLVHRANGVMVRIVRIDQARGCRRYRRQQSSPEAVAQQLLAPCTHIAAPGAAKNQTECTRQRRFASSRAFTSAIQLSVTLITTRSPPRDLTNTKRPSGAMS